MGTPFTTNWIQALMPSASLPSARAIRPSLDWVDRICVQRDPADLLEAAQALWDYAGKSGLQDILQLLPAQERRWRFMDDDTFLFQRVGELGTSQFEGWVQALGGLPGKIALQGEVTHADWSTLVRREAVRLQKPFDLAGNQQGNTLHVPCEASWQDQTWTITFTDVDWLSLRYEEAAIVPRPAAETIQASVELALAAQQELLPARMPAVDAHPTDTEWMDCVRSLQDLHDEILRHDSKLHPWLRRVWASVWPVIYREQNVLAGRADLEALRGHLHQCLKHAPQATVWMFVLAKIVCETQLGRGLGVCADYVDDFEA